MMLLAFTLGVVSCAASVYFGFWLGRMNTTVVPSLPSLPENYEGAVLDFAVYPDQVADDE